jgi:hypothetical protein
MEGKNRWQTQTNGQGTGDGFLSKYREAQKFPFTPSEFLLKQLRRDSPLPQPWYPVGNGSRKHQFNYKRMESTIERFYFLLLAVSLKITAFGSF